MFVSCQVLSGTVTGKKRNAIQEFNEYVQQDAVLTRYCNHPDGY